MLTVLVVMLQLGGNIKSRIETPKPNKIETQETQYQFGCVDGSLARSQLSVASAKRVRGVGVAFGSIFMGTRTWNWGQTALNFKKVANTQWHILNYVNVYYKKCFQEHGRNWALVAKIQKTAPSLTPCVCREPLNFPTFGHVLGMSTTHTSTCTLW